MLQQLSDALWGPGTLVLLLGTGGFLTVRLRFLPWRRLPFALRSALGREARQAGPNGVSPFSALMTALAATVGTGNIVGVATALAAGGPGALVWMEVSALLGMSTIFTESALAVRYRRRGPDGRWTGGPMYVMEAAFGSRGGRILGALFSLFAVGTSLGVGGMAQANAITGALGDAFGLPLPAVALSITGLTLLGILGGARGIARITSFLVPVMAALYLAAGLAVICGNLHNLPSGLALILRSALSPRAAAGGAAGIWAAARWGVARGVFSNEAGIGSAGIAAASADGVDPVRQGYISMTGAFFDTMVICTVTGLAICCSGVLGAADAAGNPVNGAALTILAFRSVLGELGAGCIAVSITLFAFSSILGWAFLGETAFCYLTHGRGRALYRPLLTLAVLWGAGQSVQTVYQLADICNAMMCIPNLLCLAAMSGEIVRISQRSEPGRASAPPGVARRLGGSLRRRRSGRANPVSARRL